MKFMEPVFEYFETLVRGAAFAIKLNTTQMRHNEIKFTVYQQYR